MWDSMDCEQRSNYYFSFIYRPLIRSPHFRTNLKTFVNKISVRRFPPFSSSYRKWSTLVFTRVLTLERDTPESKATLEKAINNVSALISNRATSENVRK